MITLNPQLNNENLKQDKMKTILKNINYISQKLKKNSKIISIKYYYEKDELTIMKISSIKDCGTKR